MTSKFLLVAQREYVTRVRKRAFIVLTLLVPLLIAGFGLFIGKIAQSDETSEIVDVRDESGLGIASRLVSTPQLKFQNVSGSLAEAKQGFQQQKHAGLLYLPAGLSETDPQGVQFFGKGNISLSKEDRVRTALTNAFAELKMQKSGLTQTQLDQLRARVPLNSVSVDETGKEKDSNSSVTTGIASALAVLIYFFIFLYGVQVMRGVGEEKSSRVMEVMLSAVKPFDLMMGKIVGIAAVGLTQFLLWGLLSWGATSVVVPLMMGSSPPAKTEVAAAPAGPATPAHVTSSPTESPIANGAAASAEQMNPANRMGVFEKLSDFLKKSNIPVGTIIFGFIVYFLGGYLLYSALFGAVGAAVDDQTDTQQFMFPITMPLILSYIVGFAVILRNPDGPVAFWMSMIPFTSPIAMVIRLPFGVPAWQLALSIGLLILGFIGTVWLAARIYRVGILMYGKKVTYKELSKWMFYKG
ncbi:ABC transporter permease [Hymenobacter baengnokdamensis]|uniref:ABC transporter permease n=1 Tax=Hymenobacter baengnokdamensis TaxID=2615203 RepID=UPI0012470D96|nr:ABC transporter permease [Hymenobacter baengnokdamensis]